MDSSNALSCRERRLNNSSNVSETCGNVSETCPYLPRCIEVLFSRRRVYKQDYSWAYIVVKFKQKIYNGFWG